MDRDAFEVTANWVGEGMPVDEKPPLSSYEGERVRLVPIVRGVNDERGLLAFVIWQAIEDAGDWHKIFYQAPDDPRIGDLYHWLNYAADMENPNTFVMFEDKESNALAGLFWFNSYKPENRQAQIHIWIAPAFRGVPTREMGEIATRYAFEVLRVKRLVGISPYAETRNLAVRCGYKETERGEYDVNGVTRTIYKVEKENPANG